MSVCAVEHLTVYRYSEPVFLLPQTFHLRPRTNTTQRLLDYRIQIEPQPTGSTEFLDQDGNLALHVWFDGLTSELSVRSNFRVEMLKANPFDFVLNAQALQLPLWYTDPLAAALTPYRDTGLIDESVRSYARSISNSWQCDSLRFLALLNQKIFETFQHITRPQGDAWRSHETLRSGSGSCRDLAVLFCDACRTVGFAARFVSGYEYASSSSPEAYMHAWAEVYLPDAGWRGYDPSRGLAVSDAHIAVAAAFDPRLAAPVAGIYSGFGVQSQMTASLIMSIEPAAAG